MAERRTFELIIDTNAEQNAKAFGDNVLQLKELRQEQRKLIKEAENLQKGTEEYDKQSKAINSTAKQIEGIQEEQRKIIAQRKGISAVGSSYNDLVKTTNALRAELKNLPDGFDATSKKAQELRKQIAANTEQLKEFDKELGDNFRNVGNYGDALSDVSNIFPSLGNGLDQAKNSFRAFSNVLKGNPILLLASAVTSAGVAFVTLADSVADTRREVRLLTGKSGADLNDFTSRAKALSDVFKTDFNETIKASNTLQREFGLTNEETFKLIENGIQAGANANGDFLRNISEYSTQFDLAGLSAGEFIETIQTNVTSGVFSDKGIDAVKEAAISIRELTKPTREALDAIGLSSDEISKKLREGTTSIGQVIRDVSGRLSELPPQSAVVGQALADIFKSAGEDAGIDFIKTLKNIDGELDNVVTETNKLATAQDELIENSTELNMILTGLFADSGDKANSLFTTLRAKGVGVLVDLIKSGVNLANVFIDLYNNSGLFRSVLSTVGTVIDGVFDTAITAGKTLLNIFTGSFKAIEAFIRGDFSEISNIVKETTSNIGNDFDKFSKDAVKNVEDIKNSFNEVKKINLIEFNESKSKEESQKIVSAISTLDKEITEKRQKEEKRRTDLFLKEQQRRRKEELKLQEEFDAFDKEQILQKQKESEEEFLRELDRNKQLNNEKLNQEKQRLAFEEQLTRTTEKAKADLVTSTFDLIAIAAGDNARILKTISIIEAGINVAKGVTAALTLPPPASFLSAAAVTAAGAVQIAKISSTSVPKYEQGGFVGTIGGNRHSQGGTKFVGSDGTRFEAERGEHVFIMNRQASALASNVIGLNNMANPGVLNQLGKFENGGFVTQGNPDQVSNNAEVFSLLSQQQPIVVRTVDITDAINRVNTIDTLSTF